MIHKGHDNEKSKGISLDYASSYYDFITAGEKSRFRRKQISLINLQPGEKVLEVGCGTGVLSILAKQAVGETGKVDGVDLSPNMISRARKKAEKAFLKIEFQIASIDQLPQPDEFFDVVISSMMFHHLPIEVKERGLKEVHRVMKKKGRFLLSDFCSPHWITIPVMYLMFIWMSSTRYQLFGKLPTLLEKMDFTNVRLVKKGFFLENYLIIK